MPGPQNYIYINGSPISVEQYIAQQKGEGVEKSTTIVEPIVDETSSINETIVIEEESQEETSLTKESESEEIIAPVTTEDDIVLLRKEYVEKFNKNVPNTYLNNKEWILNRLNA